MGPAVLKDSKAVPCGGATREGQGLGRLWGGQKRPLGCNFAENSPKSTKLVFGGGRGAGAPMTHLSIEPIRTVAHLVDSMPGACFGHL